MTESILKKVLWVAIGLGVLILGVAVLLLINSSPLPPVQGAAVSGPLPPAYREAPEESAEGATVGPAAASVPGSNYFDGQLPRISPAGSPKEHSKERWNRLSSKQDLAKLTRSTTERPSASALLDVVLVKHRCGSAYVGIPPKTESYEESFAEFLANCTPRGQLALGRAVLGNEEIKQQALSSVEGPLYAGYVYSDLNEYYSARGESRSAALIRILYESGDIMAVSMAADKLAHMTGEFGINGQKLSPVWQANMAVALQLVDCELGANCGRVSRTLVQACMMYKMCTFESKYDLFRANSRPPAALLVTDGAASAFSYTDAKMLSEAIANSIRFGGNRILTALQ